MKTLSEAWFLPPADKPKHGWKPENAAVVAVAGAIALIVVLGVLGARALEHSTALAEQVGHTYHVIREVDRATTDMAAVATSVQGYVLSGDEALLPVREQAVSDAESSLRDLQELTAENPFQQAQIAELIRTPVPVK